MKKFSEWVMVLLFSGTLLVLMAATILLPKERYSYYETATSPPSPRSASRASRAERSSVSWRPCSATTPPGAPPRSAR